MSLENIRTLAPDRDSNYIINSEKTVTDHLKGLKSKTAITEPVGSKPKILYGSAKVKKTLNEL